MDGERLRGVPSGAPFKFGMRARRKLSAFLLAIFAGLQLVAAAPGIHALIHPDCNSPQHECAVTLFTHGQVNSSDVTIAATSLPSLVRQNETFPEQSFISREIPLPPSRGPPFVS